jgi:ABC-type Na+ efflux pump permease subunit
MNRDEISALSEHLKCLGIKAVKLDRYLQRRAWGIYYSIWATSIFLFTFLSYPIGLIKETYLQLGAYFISYAVIIISASYFSGIVFSKAKRLANLQRNLSGINNEDSNKNSLTGILLFIVLIVALIVISSGLLRTFLGIILEVTALGLVDLYVYHMLKRSLNKIPYEGLMAVSVFIFSDIGSAVTAIIFRSPEYFLYLWIPTIVIWFFASIYALYHARDELIDRADLQECVPH